MTAPAVSSPMPEESGSPEYDAAPLDPQEGLGYVGERFPSMRWPQLERILAREPLGYKVTRQAGSHRTLVAPNRPVLHLSFHDNQELPGGMVRKVLRDAGLSDDEARRLV